MLPVRAIHAGRRGVRQVDARPAAVSVGLVGVAPGHHRVPSQEGEVAALHCGIAVVARDHDCVPFQAIESAAFNEGAFCALEEDSREPVQCPVSSRGHAVWHHVRGRRCAESNALHFQVLHGVPLRPCEVYQNLQLGNHEGSIRWRGSSAVVEKVELFCSLVKKELPGIVQLFHDIFDEEVSPFVVAPGSLVPSSSESEVLGLRIVVRHIEHPVRPPCRPPNKEPCILAVLVGPIGEVVGEA
mmetsp:Transcript_38343/g.88681  ORF Transcript_38343/g.88681 Transcript_38343/m.88681 type:complete len:242 (-) Transcript_38343:853-1578(-)